MKIFFTGGLFLMGLLTSGDLFHFWEDATTQSASGKECHNSCYPANNQKMILVIEDTSSVIICNCGGCQIRVKEQKLKCCHATNASALVYTTSTNTTSIAVFLRDADTILIHINRKSKDEPYNHESPQVLVVYRENEGSIY